MKKTEELLEHSCSSCDTAELHAYVTEFTGRSRPPTTVGVHVSPSARFTTTTTYNQICLTEEEAACGSIFSSEMEVLEEFCPSLQH